MPETPPADPAAEAAPHPSVVPTETEAPPAEADSESIVAPETEAKSELAELLEQVHQRGEAEREALTGRLKTVDRLTTSLPSETTPIFEKLESTFNTCLETSTAYETEFGNALEQIIPIEPLIDADTIAGLKANFAEYCAHFNDALTGIDEATAELYEAPEQSAA